MNPLFLAIPLLLLGCGNRQVAPTDGVSIAPMQEPPTASRGLQPAEAPVGQRSGGTAPQTEERPDHVDAVAELLAARHAEDLPDRATLDRHPQAWEALAWLAEHGDLLATRARALQLLALYPDDASAELLSRTATDPAAHPSVRAGALMGLGGQALDRDAGLREIAILALEDPDPRVACAAAGALGGVAVARDALEAVARAEHRPESVRAAAQAALTP